MQKHAPEANPDTRSGAGGPQGRRQPGAPWLAALLALTALAAFSSTRGGEGRASDAGKSGDASIRAVATFESMGLYWSPGAGARAPACAVRYRPAGAAAWRQGFPLWFDARAEEYRGSLVHLNPGTSYDIELSLAGATATLAWC